MKRITFLGLALGSSLLSMMAAPGAGRSASLSVYHVGNSLTRGITLERLDDLVESTGGDYI